jgi:hypothetical protein
MNYFKTEGEFVVQRIGNGLFFQKALGLPILGGATDVHLRADTGRFNQIRQWVTTPLRSQV